jgi:hypothetical protein
MRTSEEDDEQFYRDTERIAFPALSDEQLATLESLGTRRKVNCGEIVYKAGITDRHTRTPGDYGARIFSYRGGVRIPRVLGFIRNSKYKLAKSAYSDVIEVQTYRSLARPCTRIVLERAVFYSPFVFKPSS